MAKVTLDDIDYDLDVSSETAQKIFLEVQKVDMHLKEKTNMVAILTKAKRAYIADLKQEMISSKAGLNLFE